MTKDQMNAAIDNAASESIKRLFDVFFSSNIDQEPAAFDRFKSGLAIVNSTHAKAREAVEKITGKTS